MNKPTAADFRHLSVEERIELVGDIWDTIADDAAQIKLTDKEKAILEERAEAHRQNPDAGVSWEEVKENIRSRYGR